MTMSVSPSPKGVLEPGQPPLNLPLELGSASDLNAPKSSIPTRGLRDTDLRINYR